MVVDLLLIPLLHADAANTESPPPPTPTVVEELPIAAPAPPPPEAAPLPTPELPPAAPKTVTSKTAVRKKMEPRLAATRVSSDWQASNNQQPTMDNPQPRSEQPPFAATTTLSDSPPRSQAAYLNNPKPLYPPFARKQGREGTVILVVEVTEEGAAEAVRVQSSSGSELLDHAALQAVRQWRFIPAYRHGRAVRESVEIPIRFQLSNP